MRCRLNDASLKQGIQICRYKNLNTLWNSNQITIISIDASQNLFDEQGILNKHVKSQDRVGNQSWPVTDSFLRETVGSMYYILINSPKAYNLSYIRHKGMICRSIFISAGFPYHKLWDKLAHGSREVFFGFYSAYFLNSICRRVCVCVCVCVGGGGGINEYLNIKISAQKWNKHLANMTFQHDLYLSW